MREIFNASVPMDEHFLQFTLCDATTDRVVSTNYVFPTHIKNVKGVRNATPAAVTIDTSHCDGFQQTVTLNVRAVAPIIFFYIDVLNESVKDYQLSDNGFMIVEPATKVTITYPNAGCTGTRLTMEDLRVYTVNQYMI